MTPDFPKLPDNDYGEKTPCPECGAFLKVGDFPFCKGDPSKHQSVLDQQFHRPFKEYYSLGLDRVVTSYSEAKRFEKEQGVFERRKNGCLTEV